MDNCENHGQTCKPARESFYLDRELSKRSMHEWQKDSWKLSDEEIKEAIVSKTDAYDTLIKKHRAVTDAACKHLAEKVRELIVSTRDKHESDGSELVRWGALDSLLYTYDAKLKAQGILEGE